MLYILHDILITGSSVKICVDNMRSQLWQNQLTSNSLRIRETCGCSTIREMTSLTAEGTPAEVSCRLASRLSKSARSKSVVSRSSMLDFGGHWCSLCYPLDRTTNCVTDIKKFRPTKFLWFSRYGTPNCTITYNTALTHVRSYRVSFVAIRRLCFEN